LALIYGNHGPHAAWGSAPIAAQGPQGEVIAGD